jgi:hypothetical protein
VVRRLNLLVAGFGDIPLLFEPVFVGKGCTYTKQSISIR